MACQLEVLGRWAVFRMMDLNISDSTDMAAELTSNIHAPRWCCWLREAGPEQARRMCSGVRGRGPVRLSHWMGTRELRLPGCSQPTSLPKTAALRVSSICLSSVSRTNFLPPSHFHPFTDYSIHPSVQASIHPSIQRLFGSCCFSGVQAQ